MRFVVLSIYGGIDWHDSNTTHTLLTEREDTAEVKDVNAVIARELFHTISEIHTSCEDKNKITLDNIPTESEVLRKVCAGEDIVLSGGQTEDGYSEMCFQYTAKDKSIGIEYCFGQCSYAGGFDVFDIPDEEVRYIVVENFLAPMKGVPCVQRFYAMPYADYLEAKKAMEEMKLHSEYRSVAEMIVASRTEIDQREFFQNNIRCIEAVKAGAQGNFSPYADEQMKIYGIVPEQAQEEKGILNKLTETCPFPEVFEDTESAENGILSDPRRKIMHFRADHDGYRWHNTVWPSHDDLATPEMKREIDAIYTALTAKDALTDLSALRAFCRAHPKARANENAMDEYNFYLRGDLCDYWLRLITREKDYNLYLSAYVKEDATR